MKQNTMDLQIQTDRLILRLVQDGDAAGFFELDSNPEVLRYLPGQPMTDMEEAYRKVRYIQVQYRDHGIGRWTMTDRLTGAFMGWCGIKYVTDAATNGRYNYYDLGYRLLPAYWRKGYAFEAAAACVDYAWQTLKLEGLHATVMAGNAGSARIAEKLGMTLTATFMEDGCGWLWYTGLHP
ncbi:MAG: N-acetyltransferase [Pedobacter sp.]|nr:MAG: N-acetyltransferase [Pedobacter sp.]